MAEQKFISIEDEVIANTIIETSCLFFQIEKRFLLSKIRANQFSIPRRVAMYYIKKKTKLSFKDVGYFVGGLKACSVMHGIKALEGWTDTNSDFRAILTNFHDLVHELLNGNTQLRMLHEKLINLYTKSTIRYGEDEILKYFQLEIAELPPTTDEKAIDYMINKF